MTSKTKTIWAAVVAGVSGFLGFLATLPPDTQTGIFSQLEDVFPVNWRAQIGSGLKFISMIAGIYASYHAAHAGPQTPPTNPPTQ